MRSPDAPRTDSAGDFLDKEKDSMFRPHIVRVVSDVLFIFVSGLFVLPPGSGCFQHEEDERLNSITVARLLLIPPLSAVSSNFLQPLTVA
jgi:hypothetical protein